MNRHAPIARRALPFLAAILLILTALAGPAAAQAGTFAPPHSDYGKDTDGDGLFNFLVVNASLTITAGGQFLIDGSLYAGDGTYLAYASTSRTLGTGTYIVPLDFNGLDLTKKGKDGPYRADLSLWDPNFNRLATGVHWTKAYRATDFQSPAAALLPPHSDAGEDTDGNGKYEFLALDARVQVNRTAALTLKGNLYNAMETVLLDSRQASGTYDAGVRTIPLRFFGVLIRAAQVDGPYFVRLWLYDAAGNLLSSGTYTTGPYAYTAFEELPATLAPPHADLGLDLDGNGKFDYLALDVRVRVLRPGPFTVDGELWEDAAVNPSYLTFTANATTLAAGNWTVRLHFLGADLLAGGVNGRYVAYLRLLDRNGTAVGLGQHLTNQYRASDFDPLPAAFAPPHQDYGLDTDGNGKYDVLVVEASLAVRLRLTYRLPAFLFSGAGTTLIDATANTTVLAAGARRVPLWFDGRTIYNSTFAGPYHADVQLLDPFGNLLSLTSHTTGAYARADFEAWVPPDTSPPTISGVAAAPNPQEIGGPVNVSAVVTDDRAVAGVEIALTDPLGAPLGPFAMAYHAGTGRYFFERSYAVRGPYAFTLQAWDAAGNRASASGSFAIVDTTPPTITGVLADPDPQTAFQVVNVSAAITDNEAVASARLRVWEPGGGLAVDALLGVDPVTGRYFDARPYGVPGAYAFTIAAADLAGNVASASGTFRILPLPDTTPPVITAHGAVPNPGELGATVRIFARVTDDMGVAAVHVAVTDPAGAQLGNFTMALAGPDYVHDAAYAAAGTYGYCVWAEDGGGNGAQACGSFAIRDTTPPGITDARGAPDPQELGGAVNVSALVADAQGIASVSVSLLLPDGTPVGPLAMAFDPTSGRYWMARAYTGLGTHAFTVRATDPSGNEGTAQGAFVVRDTTAPTVAAIASPDPAEFGLAVTIDATAQDAGGLAAVTVRLRDPTGTWTGPFPMAEPSPGAYAHAFTPADLGAYGFTASARDPSGNVADASGSFLVRDTTAPVANAGPDRTVAQGDTVTFDGSASSDARGVANYTWTFVDGAPIMLYGPTPSYTFRNAGTFVVTLAAEDASGNAGSDDAVVTVEPTPPPVAPPKPPTDLKATPRGDAIDLSWTAPTERTDGSPLTVAGYALYRRSAPAQPFVEVAGPTSTSYADEGLALGATYEYVVTARDDAGRESAFSAPAVAHLVAPGSLRGEVVDWTGAPIAGTLAVLMRDAVEVARVVADPEGVFLFPAVEPGTYVVRASHEGFVSRDVAATVLEGRRTEMGVILLEKVTPPTNPPTGTDEWPPLLLYFVLLAVPLLVVLAALRRRSRKAERRARRRQEVLRRAVRPFGTVKPPFRNR